MTADLSEPKFWAIGGVIYLFCMFMLWKVNLVESTTSLTGIKIMISIFFLPILYAILNFMTGDE